MYNTSDLSIAAYLMMKGMKLLNAYRGSNGQFMFEFEDPNGDGVRLAIEFTNSECAVYDNHVRNLKKILYRNQNKRFATAYLFMKFIVWSKLFVIVSVR